MADTTDLFNQVLSKLDEQGKALVRLEAAQQKQGKKLKIRTLQVEVINANQQRAEKQSQRDHEEIIERLVTVADITGKEQKALEKRVDRIEKHLNLPPVK